MTFYKDKDMNSMDDMEFDEDSSMKQFIPKGRQNYPTVPVPSFGKVPEYLMISNFSIRNAGRSLNLVMSSLSDNTFELLNLEESQDSINHTFTCLKLIKRYRRLQMQNAELSYSQNGFHLGEHTFQTLDEVEKALSNKAFL